MGKDFSLYQLMGIRMNGIMNDITYSDGEYQEIARKSDEYSDRLERIRLPVDIRLLFDSYVSEQNALLSRYGCSPTCLAFPTAKK